MELLNKPQREEVGVAAKDYLASHQSVDLVGFMDNEGNESWFRRDPRTGEPMKVTVKEAEEV